MELNHDFIYESSLSFVEIYFVEIYEAKVKS